MVKGLNPLGRKTLAASLALLLSTASAFLPKLAHSQVLAEDTSPARAQGKRILVAYFSRSGNTRVLAGQIRRALDADIFEIQPEKPYPEDYEATVEQARKERDSGYSRCRL